MPETAAIPAIMSVTGDISKPTNDKNAESKAPDNAPIIKAGETKPPTNPKQIEIKIAKIFAKTIRPVP